MSKTGNTGIDEKIMLCVSEWEPPFSSDISANKAAVMARINLSETKEELFTRPRSRFPFLKVAASIAFFVACGIALYLTANRNVRNNSSKSIVCVLPDGSEIVLSPNSSATYNSLTWSVKRSVDFSGEGFFTIQKGKPFKIHNEQGDIEVLGTKFTVWSDENDLFVHCASGHVKVTRGIDEADLLTSEFTLLENGKLTKKMVYQAEGFIPHRTSNTLDFQAVPVGIVLSELEKVFQKEIINGLPANLIYTGNLDIRNENECLEVFCKPFGAKFEISTSGDISIHL